MRIGYLELIGSIVPELGDVASVEHDVLVRCALCGALSTRPRSSFRPGSILPYRGCVKCRDRQAPMVAVTCSECGAGLKRPQPVVARLNGRGVPVRCSPCLRRRSAAREAKKAAKRRVSVLGRTCAGCGRTDGETRWGARAHLCGACERMGERNGWCLCRAPLRARGSCRAGCASAG